MNLSGEDGRALKVILILLTPEEAREISSQLRGGANSVAVSDEQYGKKMEIKIDAPSGS